METRVTVDPADNTGAATALPPEPSAASSFIDFHMLAQRVPLGQRSLREAIRRGRIPSIKLPGGRRTLFHWESVQAALLRMQRGLDW